MEDKIYGKGLKFVYFSMKGCEPCEDFEPQLKELESGILKEANGELIRVDVEQNEQLCLQFGVLTFPTVMLFKDGRQKAGIAGYAEIEYVQSTIDNVMHGRDLEPPRFEMSEQDYEAMVADMKKQGIDPAEMPSQPAITAQKEV